VAEDRIDPSDQIPEADLLEQQTPLDPNPMIDAEPAAINPDSPARFADEADRLEQQTVVPDDDEDDYPHGSSATGSP